MHNNHIHSDSKKRRGFRYATATPLSTAGDVKRSVLTTHIKEVLSIMDIEYAEKVVAFIDILGFKSLINSIKENDDLKRVHTALVQILNFKLMYDNSDGKNKHSSSELKISTFSDCIVFSDNIENYNNVIEYSGLLQNRLLGYGIISRGGISFGDLFHSNEMVYGKGMINAYKIESKASVYPRIVIDPSLIQRITFSRLFCDIFLQKDFDDLYFVNPFAFNGYVGNAQKQSENGWDSHELYLGCVDQHINDNIDKADSLDCKSKWSWLKVKFDDAKSEYEKTGITKVTVSL